MPYIQSERRDVLDNPITNVAEALQDLGNEKGDLNYVISMLIKSYIETKGISYSVLSDCTGVLSDVKTELERKVISRYEDQKETENGTVYGDMLPPEVYVKQETQTLTTPNINYIYKNK